MNWPISPFSLRESHGGAQDASYLAARRRTLNFETIGGEAHAPLDLVPARVRRRLPRHAAHLLHRSPRKDGHVLPIQLRFRPFHLGRTWDRA